MALTPNISLTKSAYNSTGWHTAVNGNFAIIDAILSEFFVQADFLGLWTNSTAYSVGDRVVDSSNSNIYTCATGHTSPASPTTFATYRASNPSHWTNTTVVAATGRGTWTTATAYVKGDFVVDSSIYAVCTANHTSGATFAGDAAYWSELVDVSGAVVADGSVTGAKFANPLTIPGATTITTGGLVVTAGGVTITAGGLNVVANSTTLQGTTIQTGGLVVTAGGLTVTAGGATITAGGLIVAADGITITGNSTINGTLGGLAGLTVASGGATITTGGLTVSAGGATITGNSTITGTLVGITGLTVASGGAIITAGGLTVTAGGITAGGDSTLTGKWTAQSFIPSSATVPTNGLYLPAANSVGFSTNTAERLRISADGAIGIGGANYGTAGQALISAGNAAPPVWGASGKVAQVVRATWATYTAFTDATPYDNTIPQNTEGAERFTATITPTNASSTLLVEVDLKTFISVTASSDPAAINKRVIAHLHRDSTANAVSCGVMELSVQGGTISEYSADQGSIRISYAVSAGSVSATTFKVRSGQAETGSPSSTVVAHNGSSADLFGGVFFSSITITEILP